MDITLTRRFDATRIRVGRSLGASLAAIALVLAAAVWGRFLLSGGSDVRLSAPPLYGDFLPRVGLLTLVPIATAVVALRISKPIASAASWSRMLIFVFGSSLAWSIGLALVDGPSGLLGSITSPHDYLAVLPDIASNNDFLGTFSDRLASYPIHVQGHPPGLPLLLHGMDFVHLAAPWFVALFLISAGATAAVAVLIALKEVAGESLARVAAPFLAFSPAAIFAVTSADALFMAVIAWGGAALSVATRARGRNADSLAIGAGSLLGFSLFLTYGAVPAALAGPIVALHRRRFRLLAIATGAASLVVVAFGLAGFWWWEGLGATVERYSAGVGGTRPPGYFVVANLAALAIVLGPAAIGGLANLRDRRVWLLAGAALAGVLLADVSGLSRGEVERIWLPFVPWLMVGVVGLPAPRRRWLIAQVVLAVIVAIVVRSPW